MTAPRHCHVLIPGDWHTRTGGFVYDRRLVLALRAAGWQVDVLRVDGAWPHPSAAERARAAAQIDALPDGACVVADGLAFGTLAAEVAPHAQRLRWVALVHHPLHLEAGLDTGTAARLRDAETRALRHARQVVVTSPATAQDVVAMGVPPDTITVVAPGSDAPAALRRPAPTPAVQLLCVATLTPRKGHAVLLRALAGLTHLPWTLHCVGSPSRDPALARRLHDLAARGPLAGRVVWHGEVDEAALQARYAAADVFVLASLHEGHGMVIDEALRHGLPVVASDAGALAQTVPRDAGLQVPAGDEAAWRQALGRVLQDAALRQRMAQAARTAARALPTWAQQAARWARVLDRLPSLPGPVADGFSADWLRLREPFDSAAREAAAERLRLGQRLARLRPRGGPWRVIDLGCGTGANLRWLAPRLGGEQQWLVTDHDAHLLATWDRQPGLQRDDRGHLRLTGEGFDARIARQRADLSPALEALPWHAAHLVTGSALLDLVSAAWLQRLAALASGSGCALLFTLSVDGRHAWAPRDAGDALVDHLFAAHQRRDKGFGPALGADAVPTLVRLLRAHGYRVHTARSDWVIEPGATAGDGAAMRASLVQGMGAAAIEQDPARAAAVAAWQARRLAQVPHSRLRVGHVDLLALPPA